MEEVGTGQERAGGNFLGVLIGVWAIQVVELPKLIRRNKMQTNIELSRTTGRPKDSAGGKRQRSAICFEMPQK